MNTEPVAWMVKNRDSGIGYVQTDEPTRMDKVANEYLPLYTRPANELQPYPTAKQYADALAEIEALKNIIANLTRINC
jgi:hypothetical protein